jgi:short-subunit dehydrogenase
VERPFALVTGASSGIGATFARALAARGYDLILVARRKERLEALAREINAGVLVADLTNDADLKLVEDRIAAADNLELLVNNAGFGTLGRFWEAELEGQDKMHRLHVLATMRLTHAALRGMVARKSGGVINVASVAGFVQTPGSTSYGATKRWINAFTEGLYLELKSIGSPVKVQALCPGFTYSEFHDVAGVDRNLIAKSLWLRAEDVVEASLRGLDRGDLFVVPGWRYKFLVRLLAIVPDGLRRWGSLRYARRAKRA